MYGSDRNIFKTQQFHYKMTHREALIGWLCLILFCLYVFWIQFHQYVPDIFVCLL